MTILVLFLFQLGLSQTTTRPVVYSLKNSYIFKAEFELNQELRQSKIIIKHYQSKTDDASDEFLYRNRLEFEIMIYKENSFPSDGYTLGFSLSNDQLTQNQAGNSDRILTLDNVDVGKLVYFTEYMSEEVITDVNIKLKISLFLPQDYDMSRIKEKFELRLDKDLSINSSNSNTMDLGFFELTLKSLSSTKTLRIVFLVLIIIINIVLLILAVRCIIAKYDYRNIKNPHIPLYGILTTWLVASSSIRLIVLLPWILNTYTFAIFLLLICVFRNHSRMQILYFDNGMNEIIIFVQLLFFALSIVWMQLLPYLVILVNTAIFIDQILTEDSKMILTGIVISSILFFNFYYVYYFRWNFWGYPVHEMTGLYYFLGCLLSTSALVLNERLLLVEDWQQDIKKQIGQAYVEKVNTDMAFHLKQVNLNWGKEMGEKATADKDEGKANLAIDVEDQVSEKLQTKSRIRGSENLSLASACKSRWGFVRDNLHRVLKMRVNVEVKDNDEEWNFDK